MKQWFKSGDPWVTLTAGAVSVSLILVFGLLLLIAARGLGHFWPATLWEYDYKKLDDSVVRLVGEIHDTESVDAQRLRDAGIDIIGDAEVIRYLVKTGNRDVTGQDFRWILEPSIQAKRNPETLMTVERREWGNLYGYLNAVQENQQTVVVGKGVWESLQERLLRVTELFAEIRDLEKGEIGTINYGLERLRLRERALELENNTDPVARDSIKQERAEFNKEYAGLQQKLTDLYKAINRDQMMVTVSTGETIMVPLSKVVHAYRPNEMSLPDKLVFYIAKVWEFVSDEPREANTEGGIFPAIFGTVMMVIIMAIMVVPFGVVAAVYLREYAKQGPLTQLIRIAVNNLAGVPSIVYGVFGLGFFVYFLGGNLDQLFFPEALPTPTFGTPGLMWASLTLALLTVPVVIVATEEGLSRIPKSVREGSLALGATKAETLWRTVLPMASPAIMTGLILAIARAAGEVAPLMLVGVVKLAPSLPLDGNMPFLHLDRKFMHLGFHIYDVGFQSPNVEAARPLVYATALLLVVVIVALNLFAITIRNRLREKYRTLEN
ncbi:MAG: phosphate ABC transporter permease PstA [Ectothiorhodospiraceae bacterium]|nr:phosphate ABC transporter permease PstA [Ectothiorhodospiraceae bacterium]